MCADDTQADLKRAMEDTHINIIKLRVQLAKENRLLTPLTYYAQDVEYLLNQLNYKVEEE